MGNFAATVQGLSVSLGGRQVLKNLSFQIEQGELVALVGASGAGKSTLLHALSRLNKDISGKVEIHGKGHVDTAIAFQEPVLLPWLTVRQNVQFGFHFAAIKSKVKFATSELDAKTDELLTKFGIADLADRKISALSGGQAQRVGIARAAIIEPNLLLLDEPFSAVDFNTRKSLQSWLKQIASDLGLTVVLVTHDIDEAILVGDRVLVLKQSGDELVEYRSDSGEPLDLKQQISYQI